MRWWAAIAMLSACYRPALEDACEARCAFHPEPQLNGVCPGALLCAPSATGGICTDGTNCARLRDAASGDAMVADADIDGPIPIDAPTGPNCYGDSLGIRRICMAMPPTGSIGIGGPFDTSPTNGTCTTYPQSGDSRDDVCLVAAANVQLGSLRVYGPRPLVVLAAETLVVPAGATIDASSHLADMRVGPGGNSHRCTGFSQTPTDTSGGAGGSFHGSGGRGGIGAPGDYGGPATTVSTVSFVRGGCAGQRGSVVSGTALALPGSGGGAIYLIAGDTLSIAGTLVAAGSGARAGSGVNGAGSGGGSGGMVGLDAPSIMFTGAIVVSGGGGSGGFDFVNFPSSGGETASPSVPAMGGPSGAGRGGAGSVGTNLNGETPPFVGMGFNAGGGGGGAGHLLVFPASQRANVVANIAPPPTNQ